MRKKKKSAFGSIYRFSFALVKACLNDKDLKIPFSIVRTNIGLSSTQLLEKAFHLEREENGTHQF